MESEGYSVATVGSGEEALNFLAENRVDLVLLDYMMPRMNGGQLAQAVRSRFPSLPVIAISGVEDLPECLLKNTNASLPKGADAEVLLSAVWEVLQGNEGMH